MSWLFVSGGQSIGASASASVLPMNIQGRFLLGLIGSPCSPRDSQESSPASQFKSITSWLLSKNLQAINAGEGVEKREPSYAVGGNAN